MNELNLEEYRCRKCRQLFYIDALQPRPFELEFGCPYGCDGNVAPGRDIVAEIKAAAGRCVSNSRGIKCYHVVVSFSGEDFEHSMKRKPRDQLEFDRWAFFMEKGLFEGNINWDNIRKCASDAMRAEATPRDAGKQAFDDDGRCVKCDSRASSADATDTVVFVGDEIVKRYDGDITNRNCVRCNHPKQYRECGYHYEDGGSSPRANRH